MISKYKVRLQRLHTYLQSIENDVQLYCILTTDGMIDLRCIGQREEDHDRRYDKQHPKDVSLLGGWNRWSMSIAISIQGMKVRVDN